MKLSKALAKQARGLNICQEWHDELMSLDSKRAMVEMYLKGIDFCLANDFPNNDFIRTNFQGVMEPFGIFLDDSIDLVNVAKCVALGQTDGRVEITDFGCSEIFVKHRSELTIIAKGDAFVMADVFDNSVIHVQAHDRAKVCVNKYGGAKVEQETSGSGMVKIIEKCKKAY
jgi:hypothetical protein